MKDFKILFKRDTSENLINFIPELDELVYIIDQQRIVVGDGHNFALDCLAVTDLAGIDIRGTYYKPKMYRMTGNEVKEYLSAHNSAKEIENG